MDTIKIIITVIVGNQTKQNNHNKGHSRLINLIGKSLLSSDVPLSDRYLSSEWDSNLGLRVSVYLNLTHTQNYLSTTAGIPQSIDLNKFLKLPIAFFLHFALFGCTSEGVYEVVFFCKFRSVNNSTLVNTNRSLHLVPWSNFFFNSMHVFPCFYGRVQTKLMRIVFFIRD